MRARTVRVGAALVVLGSVGCNVVLGIKDLSGSGLVGGTTSASGSATSSAGAGTGGKATSTGTGGQTTSTTGAAGAGGQTTSSATTTSTGMGGQTTTTGTGGQTTTTGTGGQTTSSTATSSTSTGGACDGGQACTTTSDCSQPSTLCLVDACANGCCATSPASPNTTCMDSGGKVCDGLGTCVGCLGDTNCSGMTPVCNTTTHTCVQCTALESTGCSGTTPVCDLTTGTCVQCLSNADCASPQACTPAHACGDPPSCQGLAATCGPSANEDCCASPPVSGGTFKRSYDAVSWLDPTNPAKVSDFRLDRFNITVARFRSFVTAVVGGWTPAAGSGKHAYLTGGGLNGGAEMGWDPTWTSNLATTGNAWNTNLSCDLTNGTWTAIPESNESLPINCITWFEAYAFCIWDNAFLPTEAEWNYAAAGGGDAQGQRVYPWSSPPTSATIDATYAVYGGATILAVGADSPKGDGRYGQADLAGSLREWVLDLDAAYVNPCVDCALLTGPSARVIRSGAWYDMPMYMVASFRDDNPPLTRDSFNGARCARAP